MSICQSRVLTWAALAIAAEIGARHGERHDFARASSSDSADDGSGDEDRG